MTVSAVPDEQADEGGGLQNTAKNLGASLGTALAGSVLIAVLTTSFISGIQESDDIPESVRDQADVELASGVPFISDSDLEDALADAGVDDEAADAIMESNRSARIRALDASLALLALLAVASLFLTERIPDRPPGDDGGESAPV